MHLLRMSRYIFIILALLVVGIIVNAYLYFSVVADVKNDLAFVKNQLQQEDQLLSVLQNRIAEQQEIGEISTEELQKRLPSEPLLDQFILQLQRAETISTGTMLSLSFGTGDLGEVIFFRDEDEDDEDSDVAVEETPEEEAPPVQEEQLPEGIKKLTVNMSYRVGSYENLLQFLSVIESFDRITKIDTISFAGSRNEDLNVSLTLSTFYAEGLDELIEDLPQIEHLDPANKSNPLPRRRTNDDD